VTRLNYVARILFTTVFIKIEEGSMIRDPSRFSLSFVFESCITVITLFLLHRRCFIIELLLLLFCLYFCLFVRFCFVFCYYFYLKIYFHQLSRYKLQQSSFSPYFFRLVFYLFSILFSPSLCSFCFCCLFIISHTTHDMAPRNRRQCSVP